MLIGLLLGLATPSPAPALPVLKTITHIRATPFCSALRSHVGPAITSILDGDRVIQGAAPFFGAVDQPGARAQIQQPQRNLENLITPIVRDMDAARAQLDQLPNDAKFSTIRQQLRAVIDKQNEALNAISGYVYTDQFNEMLDFVSPVPSGSATLSSAHMQAAKIQAERYPHVTPYQAAAHDFSQAQAGRDAAEQRASQFVLDAARECSGG